MQQANQAASKLSAGGGGGGTVGDCHGLIGAGWNDTLIGQSVPVSHAGHTIATCSDLQYVHRNTSQFQGMSFKDNLQELDILIFFVGNLTTDILHEFYSLPFSNTRGAQMMIQIPKAGKYKT